MRSSRDVNQGSVAADGSLRGHLSRRTLLVGVGATLAAPAAATTTTAPADATTTATRAEKLTAATSQRPRFGSWVEGMDANPALLTYAGQKIGVEMSIASVFRGRGDAPWWPYTADYALGVQAGRELLVSWSLQEWGNFKWWASGKGDRVLRAQAAKLSTYAGPVVLRPWAEMNGDWVDFQPLPTGVTKRTPRGGTPAQFIAAWRRVVKVVRAAASNVRFCFNPTTDTYAETTDIATIFPGRSWVDVLGLDGYNWGTAGALRWQSFTDIYAAQYDRLVALHPTAPVWICEVSSADPASAGRGPIVTAPPGQTKGLWWEEMMTALPTSFPAVQAVSFFDCDKERDWRVDSSADALAGLQRAVQTVP